jgi:neutral ceramidase
MRQTNSTRVPCQVAGRGRHQIGRLWICGIALFLVGWIGGASAQAAGDWKAGTARVNITPQQFMGMAGYGGRTSPADGTFCDLWAKALVLEDANGSRALLLAMDLIGMDGPLSDRLCQTLAQGIGVKRSDIALCFSHTHTGPVVGRNLEPLHYRQLDDEQQHLIDTYAQHLVELLATCVKEAAEDLQPCQLSWGSGSTDFAVNRRNNPERDVPKLRAAGLLKGPVDHDVPVLAVRLPSGKLKAVVFGYACHATVLSDTKWSGDYPGFAQRELESSFPGSTALFWAGCGADQNPLPRRRLELAQQYGKRLADAVGGVLADEMTPVAGTLTTRFRKVPLALDTLPTAQELARDAQSENRFVRERAKMLLEKIESEGQLAASYPYPVGVWRIGDEVQFIFLGGEVVVDFSIRLKKRTARHGNVGRRICERRYGVHPLAARP